MERDPYPIIQNSYSGYSKTFRRIADYILEHEDAVPQMNIRQLAKEIDIAESSIIRFCKALGFSGFSDMKVMLARYSHRQTDSVLSSMKLSSPEKSFRDIFSLSIETLQIARDQMDFSTVEALTDQVCRAKHCIILGVGASASVANSFAAHLLRIGIAARAETDSELMQMLAQTVDEDTVVIAISKSGRNLPLVRAFEIAKARHAVTACLSGFQDTPLGRLCDIQVVHYCPPATLMNCRIVQNTIIDWIYLTVALRRQENAEHIYLKNREAIHRLYIEE